MPRVSERGWLLDTNVVSELRKGPRCHAAVRAWAKAVPRELCFLSSVTLAEIQHGIEAVTDPEFRLDLEAWLRDGVRAWFGQRILAADEAVLHGWIGLMREGRARRHTYSQPDALIAATALAHGCAVVTRNTEDFIAAGVAVLNPWAA